MCLSVCLCVLNVFCIDDAYDADAVAICIDLAPLAVCLRSNTYIINMFVVCVSVCAYVGHDCVLAKNSQCALNNKCGCAYVYLNRCYDQLSRSVPVATSASATY